MTQINNEKELALVVRQEQDASPVPEPDNSGKSLQERMLFMIEGLTLGVANTHERLVQIQASQKDLSSRVSALERTPRGGRAKAGRPNITPLDTKQGFECPWTGHGIEMRSSAPDVIVVKRELSADALHELRGVANTFAYRQYLKESGHRLSLFIADDEGVPIKGSLYALVIDHHKLLPEGPASDIIGDLLAVARRHMTPKFGATSQVKKWLCGMLGWSKDDWEIVGYQLANRSKEK